MTTIQLASLALTDPSALAAEVGTVTCEAQKCIVLATLDAVGVRAPHVTVDSDAYFERAIDAARLLGDRAAEGLALLRKSFVELYGKRDPKAALRLTTHTAEVTNGTSHVLTGLAVLHAAEAHAMLGDQRDCEQALSRAETHFRPPNF